MDPDFENILSSLLFLTFALVRNPSSFIWHGWSDGRRTTVYSVDGLDSHGMSAARRVIVFIQSRQHTIHEMTLSEEDGGVRSRRANS